MIDFTKERDELLERKDSPALISGSLADYFDKVLQDPSLTTCGISYDLKAGIMKIQVFKNSLGIRRGSVINQPIYEKDYFDFVREYLEIDPDSRYNDSSNIVVEGIPVRVFAMTAPYAPGLNITLSTQKHPPLTMELEKEDLLLDIVHNGSFLISGASGAGKTYLLNYLLSKPFPTSSRVGLIQEFNEIWKPNEYTDCLTIPPRKPGQQYNDLEFLCEQSNLMRYDHIFVGEIKSSEAWSFVKNAASGTKCGATIHGIRPRDALNRLVSLCLLAAPNIDKEGLASLVKDSIDAVIQVEKQQITSISRIASVNHGKFALEEL